MPMCQKIDTTFPLGFELVDYNKIQKSTHLTFIFASSFYYEQKVSFISVYAMTKVFVF